jgi:hypothetical protein
MKLGIVVVYLVKQEDAPLLDLHLAQIEKHTSMPYTIYAGAARLLPEFRHRLSQNARTRICDFKQTHLRRSEEHAFYLEQLINIALKDGATHIAILHVDSFPVRAGWAEELVEKLSGNCVLAAIMRDRRYDRKPNTSCMFFHRDFITEYHPSLLLPGDELASREYNTYLKSTPVLYDSGIGYGFIIHQKGLSWHPLERTNRAADHFSLGGIFGDIIFHLGSLNLDVNACPGDEEQLHVLSRKRKVIVIARKIGMSILPEIIKRRLKQILPGALLKRLYPQHAINNQALLNIKKCLLADPEGYLNYLRTGGPRSGVS